MISASDIMSDEARARVVGVFDGMKRLATIEQVLATICILIPAGLMLFDNEDSVRDSISAYYDMNEAQWFYVPITAAATLFIVNGIVKNGRFYNWILGAGLLLVVMFDHDSASGPHFLGAFVFFGGNIAVMALLPDTDLERRLRWPMLGICLIALAGWLWVDGFTTFWAEWLSMVVIAVHFFINAAEESKRSAHLAAA